MDIFPTLHTGKIIVISSSNGARDQISALVAELALRGTVNVLDGGNRFAAYRIVRLLRLRTPDVAGAARRIFVRRAFTCYQMLTLLENAPPFRQPYIVLDLLSSFYDENVPLQEADRLLNCCFFHLDRLRTAAPVVISLEPSLDRTSLFERACSRGDHVLDAEIPYPILTQPTLF